jgi:hypothetical protein
MFEQFRGGADEVALSSARHRPGRRSTSPEDGSTLVESRQPVAAELALATAGRGLLAADQARLDGHRDHPV